MKNTWLLAACADLLLTYGVRLRTRARSKRAVICDRFLWDALIDRRMYFSDAGWVDSVITRGFAIVGRKPDIAVLLSLPYEVAFQRSEKKDEPFPDVPEVRRVRHTLYDGLAAAGNHMVLDATRSPFWGRQTRENGLWLCNPAINAIYSMHAKSRVFGIPWREYLRGPNLVATAAHAVFLAASTAPVARNMTASHHVYIEPDMGGANDILILGGNARLKIIDYRLKKVTTILKAGFSERLINRELEYRTNGRVELALPVLDTHDSALWFTEPLLHGTVADRMMSRSEAECALIEALEACRRLAARTSRGIPISEWVGRKLDTAEEAARGVHGDGVSVVHEAIRWMSTLCRWLLRSENGDRRVVEVAVSHGDLQPGNVLVESDRVWLIDWERVGERVPWYDAWTLALDSRRACPGLVRRLFDLEGYCSDRVGQRVCKMAAESEGTLSTAVRKLMYLVEEILFCLEESAMGPLHEPTNSLVTLVQELEGESERLALELRPQAKEVMV